MTCPTPGGLGGASYAAFQQRFARLGVGAMDTEGLKLDLKTGATPKQMSAPAANRSAD
jgi:hypothetical protein